MDHQRKKTQKIALLLLSEPSWIQLKAVNGKKGTADNEFLAIPSFAGTLRFQKDGDIASSRNMTLIRLYLNASSRILIS